MKKYYIDEKEVERVEFIASLNSGNYRLAEAGEAVERLQSGNPEHEIAKLKQNLLATDYQAIKYAEGELSAEEYSPTKEQRREWRRRINELES